MPGRLARDRAVAELHGLRGAGSSHMDLEASLKETASSALVVFRTHFPDSTQRLAPRIVGRSVKDRPTERLTEKLRLTFFPIWQDAWRLC